MRRSGTMTFLLVGMLAIAGPAAGQASGAISGHVRDATTGRGIVNVVVTVEDGRRGAVTDTSGAYRIRELRSGSYVARARGIGYQPVVRDSVTVQGGGTTLLDIVLRAGAVQLDSVTIQSRDPVLDPFATATEQTVTAADLRELPVSTVEEAIALSAGAVGQSYRGGRLGQEAFIIDGLGLKNQLDASTGSLGVRLPPDILTEASLVTNGFSARYGQALSGLINVVTKDGGARWGGRAAYESDRPFGSALDYGLDRVVIEADGPVVNGIRALAAVDATARLDADPVNAPAPSNPLDPRNDNPRLLPHNSGDQVNMAAKLTIPFGRHETIRLFGLRSTEQRLLYDPAYKYDGAFAPASRTAGSLASVHVQHASSPEARTPLVADLRIAYFGRDYTRGTLTSQPDFRLGAFTRDRFHFVGEDLARAQDTVAGSAQIPGFTRPFGSDNTPWGVPALFMGGGSSGGVAWNRFSELRSQLDVTLGAGSRGDIYAGAQVVQQRVRTFQRVLGYLPSGIGVPPATAASFSPLSAAAYVESQLRFSDVALTAGVRYDRFDTRADLPGNTRGSKHQINPRVAVSTVLKGATVVASGGAFSQAPDYQYLVDAAFDDTTRTGRFRQGNPDLGFERSWQYELSVRGRPRPGIALRAGIFLKRLDGLVSAVPLGANPDSSFFGNEDVGTVRGAELMVDREVRGGWGIRASYALQQANATSTSAFLLRRTIRIDPLTHDTTFPSKTEFPLDYDRRHSLTVIARGRVQDGAGPSFAGIRPLAGFEAAVIGRYLSGLPFTRRALGVDTLLGAPNDSRLPATSTIDLLLRRPLRIGTLHGSVYLDARNVLNRRNIVAVRRDTGVPEAADSAVALLATAAYNAHPEAIPYESRRYRAYADLNGDGLIQGRSELYPLYEAAARDYTQPLFAYGSPRLARLGFEFVF
ncbi:MAG: TonB-dependent receptor [Gemmatimonadales bacterium]|nr:TonB-dependent receptor [Gemmatimonadales bacterium]